MAKLGKRLWDDDGFALATILPKTDAIDIGSVDRPFRNMYLSGDISFEDAVFTGDMTVGDDILFDASTVPDHDITVTDATGVLRVWAGTAFGAGTASYIQLGGGAAGDVYINAIDDFAVSLAGVPIISAVNTSAVTIGGNTDLIINKDDGGIRRPDDTGRLFIGGGSALDISNGPLVQLSGVSDSNAGQAYLQGASVATGHINFKINHASATARVLDSSGAVNWSFDDSGDMFILKDNKSIRMSVDTQSWYISGSHTISGANGALIYLSGINDGAGGVLRLFGGAAATGNIEFQINHSSSDVRIKNTSGSRVWSFNNAGEIVPPVRETYTITNVSTDRAYDANATTLDEVADTLGTLIDDLRTLGLVA